jgi:phospholipid/cholesterol/gamma-HCH transport system substrate-binding protein
VATGALSRIGRIAVAGAGLLAVVVVAIITLDGGARYSVTANFQNASQIVSGDLVEVAGTKVGTVGSIRLDANGEAALTLNFSSSGYTPLHEGTTATIREVSLSGIANRYVDLQLGPAANRMIPDHGQIAETDTTSEVDLDELFDTLDAPTRLGLQNLIQGAAAMYRGEGAEARQAFRYLNPAVASASSLFAEINHDSASFTAFLDKSGKLMSDIATRQSQLSGVITNLSEVTSALASQHTALSQSIAALPVFQREADTTFTGLRTSLKDLTPLVNTAKPVAPELRRFLAQLVPLAQQAVPTFRSLSATISKPGADNDLTDLTRLGVPLAKAAVDEVTADGAARPGAFPVATAALNDSTPELAFARPYAVDLTGWFEGFSHPGGYDANGAYSRVALDVGVGTISNGVLNLLTPLVNAATRQGFAFGSGSSQGLVSVNNADRCPGSMERGAIYYPETGYACTPTQVPTGN